MRQACARQTRPRCTSRQTASVTRCSQPGGSSPPATPDRAPRPPSCRSTSAGPPRARRRCARPPRGSRRPPPRSSGRARSTRRASSSSLNRQRPFGLDHDVELVILRVDADRAAPERRLQVHVPGGERPLRALARTPTRRAPRPDAAAGGRRDHASGPCRSRGAGRRANRRPETRARIPPATYSASSSLGVLDDDSACPSHGRPRQISRRTIGSPGCQRYAPSPNVRSRPFRRRHAPERGRLGRGALPAHRNGARRQAVRADPRRRRVDRRHLGGGRAAARGRPPRPRRALQAQLRPAPGHARGPLAGARRDRRDDGRRPAEPAGGHSAPRRGGRGRRRRGERPARRAQRLVGPDAALAADQRDAAPLHRRLDLRLRLRLQRLPAQRGRADAARDREAEVHEGARSSPAAPRSSRSTSATPPAPATPATRRCG